jgi:ribosomal protein L7Ae-like RNA K-turn-binding protein
VVPGVDGTRALLQREECCLVVVAEDASPRAVDKVVRLCRATGIRVVAGPAAAILGERLGRPPVMVVGVRDRRLADGLVAAATANARADEGV